MTVFFYKATDKSGKYIEGDVDAPDYRAAVQHVRRLNYFPIKISQDRPRKALASDWQIPGLGFFSRVTQKDLLTVTQQLATLIDAGITLDSSLSNVAQLADKPRVREVLNDVQKRVHSGSSFAEALAEHPRVFSRLYINMVRAGETGGVLSASLARLAGFMERSEDLKSSIRSAMVYPAILVLVGGGAVVFLFAVVIPQFDQLFQELGQALPWSTQLMLWFSEGVTNYWWLLLFLLIMAFTAFRFYVNSDKGGKQWDRLMLKTPLLGSLIQKIEVSRFSFTLATLLKSGIPVLEAVTLVKTILTNRVLVASMDQLHEGLKGGKGLTVPLQQANVFPSLAIHMITVGETSGSLDTILEKMAKTYDKEVEVALKRMLSLVEPAMILIMAVLIGFIVISMLMGIFSVNEVSF